MKEVVLDLNEVVDEIMNGLKPRLIEEIREKYADDRNEVRPNREVKFGGLKKVDGTPIREPIVIAGDIYDMRINMYGLAKILRGQGLEVIIQREFEAPIADYNGISFESIAEHVDTIKRLAKKGKGTLLVSDRENHTSDSCNMAIEAATKYNMPIVDTYELFEEKFAIIQHVCICGSYKFIDEMKAVARYFMNNGLAVSVPRKLEIPEGDTITDYMARAIHLSKILHSNLVVVVDPNGYIGENTLHEIEFAESRYKHIFYTEQPEMYKVDPEYIGLEKAMDWVHEYYIDDEEDE